jgi:hypothetical protein
VEEPTDDGDGVSERLTVSVHWRERVTDRVRDRRKGTVSEPVSDEDSVDVRL